MELVDFKVARPDNSHGKSEESCKTWARRFQIYCNVRKDGYKTALEWAETFEGEAMNERTIDQMGWPRARAADQKLCTFLVLQCRGDALVIVEHCD